VRRRLRYPSPVDAAHLHDLLPDADYEFTFKVRPGTLSAFYGSAADDAAVLEERRRTVREFPRRHLLLDPVARAALRELVDQMSDLGLLPQPSGDDAFLWLSDHLAPDVLLLLPDDRGRPCLRAAAVCFPSGWAPEEKFGLPLAAIHDVVPELNAVLGDRIHGFLQRIKPGALYLRENWGFAASSQRNLHPVLPRSPLHVPLDPEHVWFRVERQAFHRLPHSGAVVFGIRLEIVSLVVFRERFPGHVQGLIRGLQTMPPAMASYKGVADVRDAVADWLRG